MSIKLKAFLNIGLFFMATSAALATDLQVVVTNAKNGIAADHAVITLQPLFKNTMKPSQQGGAVMRQEGSMFHPFVLAVSTGTAVSFPNFDNFRHHVYSFSKTKKLELRLYGKDETHEIVFDKAGIVALGCNIHDNMLAYIHVSDAPYSRIAGQDGAGTFAGLAVGKYALTVWHPDQKSRTKAHTEEIMVTDGMGAVNVSLKMRSRRRLQASPGDNEYD
ncbi:MAG: hypothetical protein JKY34_16115 [Kordiimonadaceae bacterium]|nr:hypothetical protein [Kordiimonadaceae bacterium]